MDKTAIIVCAVVGSLGVLSALLGFIAEGANLYNRSPALGICASLFLLAAQITVSAVGGCCGCCKSRAIPSETNRVVGIVCAVVSWILAVIALALFYRGAWLNSLGYYLTGLYAGGSVLTFIATALGITSFIMLRSQQAADGEVVAVSGAPRPSTQQPPLAPLMVVQPQLPPREQSKPDVQPLAAGVVPIGAHPLSSPGTDAGVANIQEGKQPPPPEAIPIGYPLSEPAMAPQSTVNRQREQPLPYITGATSQPQVSLATLPHGIKPEKQQTSIGNQMLKKGAETGVELLVDTVLSDNTDPLTVAGDAFILATGAAGGETEATGSEDALAKA